MFFYKKRSKKLEENVFNNNEDFYKSNINLKDLKMLITKYGQVKNIKISYPKLALFALTMMEKMIAIFLCALSFIMMFFIFSSLKISSPFILSFFIHSIFFFFGYRYMLAKGIKDFIWWQQFKPGWEEPSILIKFMKEQIIMDEKKLIIDKCSIKSHLKKEEMRETCVKKRL